MKRNTELLKDNVREERGKGGRQKEEERDAERRNEEKMTRSGVVVYFLAAKPTVVNRFNPLV